MLPLVDPSSDTVSSPHADYLACSPTQGDNLRMAMALQVSVFRARPFAPRLLAHTGRQRLPRYDPPGGCLPESKTPIQIAARNVAAGSLGYTCGGGSCTWGRDCVRRKVQDFIGGIFQGAGGVLRLE